MKLDILCFGAHPDDVELSMAGTLALQKSLGYKTGIIDLTKGEMGSRGTVEIRKEEAAAASQVLELDVRENLGMPDAFFELSKENKLAVVNMIRKYQPDFVFCNAPSDRHPDHGRGAELVKEACFLSGLVKVHTENAEPWRPKNVFHYIQDYYHEPDFIIDVTEVYETKVKAVMAFASQFYNPVSDGPETPISSPEFLKFLEGRAAEFGRRISAKYGEGFIAVQPLHVSDLNQLKG